MSNYQIVAPNYTQTPNVLFDYWMNVLTPAEFKVACCICRKTFGWGKESDTISIKQIEKMTGLGKSGIVNHIDKLIAHGLIQKIKSKTSDGDDAPNQYTMIVHSVGGGSPLSGQGVVHSMDKGVVHSVDTQKKANTKERHTKEQPPPTPKGGASQVFLNSKLEKGPYGEFVMLTKAEYEKLLVDYGESKLAELLDILNAYIGSSGKRYKSHWHVLLPSGWVNTEHLKRKSNPSYAAAEKFKKTQDIEETILKNRKVSEDCEKHFRKMPNRPDIRIFVDNDYIQIGNDKIYFKEKTFKQLLLHSLVKYKFQEHG